MQCTDAINRTDTLFYDGSCPLCSREIQHLSQRKRASLSLVNIHTMTEANAPGNISKAQLMARLHLRLANGQWLTGLDATVAAWGHTNVGWLFAPLRWPLIKQISDWCYDRWAAKRVCQLS